VTLDAVAECAIAGIECLYDLRDASDLNKRYSLVCDANAKLVHALEAAQERADATDAECSRVAVALATAEARCAKAERDRDDALARYRAGPRDVLDMD
jgi:hypothetical protein